MSVNTGRRVRRASAPTRRLLFRTRVRREDYVGKLTEQEAVRRAIAGPRTDKTRREIADRVSEPVKRAIDQAIKQNRPALKELANH